MLSNNLSQVLAYVLFSALVLGGAVLSKGATLLMTSAISDNSRKKTERDRCRSLTAYIVASVLMEGIGSSSLSLSALRISTEYLLCPILLHTALFFYLPLPWCVVQRKLHADSTVSALSGHHCIHHFMCNDGIE